ncbi:MAG: serine/threonine-protein kinase [Myxococcota bacterium]
MIEPSEENDLSELETIGANTAPRAPSEPAPAAIGDTIGRYVVLEQVGYGGMGRVLRAYDPKLGREVALKLLRSDVLDQKAQARLVREARAMARLSHPSVVAVHDVDHTPLGAVVVMEFVRGQTLREWLHAQDRPWPAIIERFVQAGRGLAAAHDEGLLHRDFKASNVLIPESGPAKVTDFGLAKIVSEPSTYQSASIHDEPPMVDGALTQDGVVMGTPTYMAPEQHRGDTIGPAVDQYAFCVTLWEALAGSPPFAGAWRELYLAKRVGPPPWPEAIMVPRALQQAVLRGLEPEPQLRWPTMGDLLHALTPKPPARRRPWLTVAGGLGLLGLGGLTSLLWDRDSPQPCTGARAQLRGVWDQPRRAEVEAAMLKTRAGYAPQAWAMVRDELDAYADAWTTMHTETCTATTIRGEQSVQVMDLRMACLHRAKTGLSATVEVLAKADTSVLEKAHRVVGDLDSLERCADIEVLRGEVGPPAPEDAPAVERADQSLARARALLQAGHYPDARRSVDEATMALDGVSYLPAKARIELVRGHVLDEQGDYPGAEAAYRSSMESSLRLRQWDSVQHAAAGLMFVLGAKQEKPGDALHYRSLAEQLAVDARAKARVHDNLGHIRYAEGKYELAAAEHHLALEQQLTVLDREHPEVASTRNNLSNALWAAGKYEQAEAEQRRALEIRITSLGADHPFVAMSRGNLANILKHQGKYEQAEAECHRALEQLESSVDPEHPNIASIRNNYANILSAQGRYAEAEAEHRRIIEFRLRVLGPRHPSLLSSISNLGHALHSQGKYEQAQTEYRRALELSQELFDDDHPTIAAIRNNLGNVLAGQRKYELAEHQLHLALTAQQETIGDDHPDVAMTHENLGQIMTMQGRYEQGEAELRRALAIRRATLPAQSPDIATSLELLGLCLYEQAQYADAEVELRQAVQLHQEVFGPEHPSTLSSSLTLARALLAREHLAEARALVKSAWSRLEGDDDLREEQAEAAFLLAEILRASGEQPARALALARRARQIYEQVGVPGTEAVRQIDRWLEEG